MKERTILVVVAVVAGLVFATEHRATFFAACAPGDRLALACMLDALQRISSLAASDAP